MIKLILCDMDMTLVPLGCLTVSDVALDAMHQLVELGVRVGAASGRGRGDLVRQFCGDEVCLRTAVASNGCEVWLDGAPLSTHPLDREDVVRLLAMVREVPDVFLTADVDGDRLALGAPQAEVLAHFGGGGTIPNLRVVDDLPTGPLVKVNVCLPRSTDPQAIAQNRAVVVWLQEACQHTDLCLLGSHVADLMPTGISKASGVHELMAAIGASPDEVLVFGDSENDEQMLACVPGSVAVANATPKVRSLARYHIGPFSEDATAHALAEAARALRAGEEPAWMAPEANAAALDRAINDPSLDPELLRDLHWGSRGEAGR